MKKPVFFAAALVSSLSVSACGDKSDDTTDNGEAIQATPSQLQGRWKSACIPASALQLNKTQREYIFNAIGDFDKYERFYSDDACTNLIAEYKVIGTVEVKGAAPEAEDTGAKLINYTVNDASLRVANESMVPYLNGLKACGRSDWTVGSEVSVLNADCLGYALNKGDVVFDLYDVKDGQLYFGKSFLFLAPTTADARPSNLNLEVPFAKQ